jgi:hypothetical protein
LTSYDHSNLQIFYDMERGCIERASRSRNDTPRSTGAAVSSEFLLLFQLLYLLLLPVYFGLILVHLPLCLRRLFLLALEIVPDQCAADESRRGTNGCADPRVAGSGANDPAEGRAANGSADRSLLPGRELTTLAPYRNNE